MKVEIKETNVEVGEEVKKLIERKISSLEKLVEGFVKKKKRGKNLIKKRAEIEAWVEIAKTTHHHKKGPFFYAECQLNLPGMNFRAVSEKEDLISAIEKIKEILEREIRDAKQKLKRKFEIKARKMKERVRSLET